MSAHTTIISVLVKAYKHTSNFQMFFSKLQERNETETENKAVLKCENKTSTAKIKCINTNRAKNSWGPGGLFFFVGCHGSITLLTSKNINSLNSVTYCPQSPFMVTVRLLSPLLAAFRKRVKRNLHVECTTLEDSIPLYCLGNCRTTFEMEYSRTPIPRRLFCNCQLTVLKSKWNRNSKKAEINCSKKKKSKNKIAKK